MANHENMERVRERSAFFCLGICLSLVLVFAGCGAGVSPLDKTVELKMPPKGEPSYVYIPFNVPSGVRSLAVGLAYDKKDGKNRLELGLFDERFSGQNDDKKGLRGWSGSVRDGFFVATDDATSGYQKGPINAGKWYVAIGLAALEETGVSAKIRVDFDQIPSAIQEKHDQESAKTFNHETINRKENLEWYRGDLHSHTFHSDGRWSVKGVLDSAQANGLEFVSITDHNTYSHHEEVDSLAEDYKGLLVLKGEEVTTYGGHINIWGLSSGDWVDFRVPPKSPESARKIADEAHAFGALASANHPTMNCGGCTWTYGNWAQMDAVEIWNAKWDAEDEEALRIWDGLLQTDNRITAIGSSDTHQPPYEPSDYPTNLAVGSPTVYVERQGALNRDNLFKSIKEGRVFVAEDSKKQIVFSAFKGIGVGETAAADTNGVLPYFVRLSGFVIGSKIRVITKLRGGTVGTMTREIKDSEVEFERTVKANMPGYMRLEVRNPDGSMAAFTNPIWITKSN